MPHSEGDEPTDGEPTQGALSGDGSLPQAPGGTLTLPPRQRIYKCI